MEKQTTRQLYCNLLQERLKAIEVSRGVIFGELETLAHASVMSTSLIVKSTDRLYWYALALKETADVANKYYEIIQAIDSAVSENDTSADEDTNNGEYYPIPKYND